MSKKRRIIFRADGNNQIGLGHVVRSLALVSMLREEFECVFAIQAPSRELQHQISKICHGLIMLPVCAPSEVRFNHELDAYISSEEMVVLDGYNFNTKYQESIKSKGCPLVCLDDIQAYTFVADTVVNQAGGVKAHLYNKAAYTKLLLGPKYALLRPPFLKASKEVRIFTEDKPGLLLNMGGADPGNKTLQLAKELTQKKSIGHIEIVVGAAYRHLVELQAWLQDKQQITLHHNLTAKQMRDVMQHCAIAVTSASGVAYEYASVGGLLVVLQSADNQEGLYNFLIESGIAHEYQELNQLLKDELSKNFKQQVEIQRQHFDGHSDVRLKQLFRKLSLSASLILREATEEDTMLLFDWANDPEVRKNSFNPNPINIDNHKIWYKAVLEDEQTLLYIAEAEGKPVAHIRFNISRTGKALISYLIDADFRGQGLGLHLLQKGLQALYAQQPEINQAEGLVQRENIASVRSFEKAGFSYGQPDPEHPQAHRFIFKLN